MSTETVITFVGAGSVEFTQDLLTDLAAWDAEMEMIWRLHDIDPDRLGVAVGAAEQLVASRGLRARVESHRDRDTALPGSDAIVVTVMVGGLEATRADLEIPLRAGLRQTIGDTLGVGGIFRGLRTAGFYSQLVEDVRRLCPDAWILNYTNPMAINVDLMSRLAPELTVLGLCHSVHWTIDTLSGILGVPMAEVEFTAAGVNHQSWVLRLERDGEDLHPLLDERIAADPELRRRVRVDMYRRLGRFPTESSEHSAEYVAWYLPHEAQVERFRLEPGEYIGISEQNLAEYHRTAAAVAEGRPLDFGTEAVEYAPQVIHSLATGTRHDIYATVPNRGWIDNLPAEAAVEVPVTIEGKEARPHAVGALPEACAALNRRFLDVVGLTVEAALSGDPELVRRAALLDPNASASLAPDELDAVLTELSRVHAAHLPDGLADHDYTVDRVAAPTTTRS
ncbi:alpha-glucosidase/alpha-galactosidase [Nocardioides sp. Root122]|uniref:family 4 glycosyl hydrolase n=1 Tax=Nocardioides TaxID=1839 RepID=UPI0007030E0B|nr:MULTISPECIES: alpha-glucosidase/alpha-galactosidase [Nocardioides]KQV63419.1 alpha-glucosidase/alpha-galactosidase [Nocardioides sp. Root122]MCK9824342.1 alpha-glucosidase/alpha-galactosidase [Nocardioides cavernae]